MGPHGAGKSTLLRTLFAEVERRDLPTVLFSFNDQRRRLPFGWRRCIARGGVCFLDGGEVLPAFALRRLDRATHRHGCGLIVTTHAPLGIAPAHQVTPDPETFALLVSNLLIDTQYVVSDEHAMQILLAHGGDAREALWALYDEFESFAVE
ncbi:ABC transporter ATP-binding protein [bacterium]|nr:ABC transporter ATP-binding protein [bacterium]